MWYWTNRCIASYFTYVRACLYFAYGIVSVYIFSGEDLCLFVRVLFFSYFLGHKFVVYIIFCDWFSWSNWMLHIGANQPDGSPRPNPKPLGSRCRQGWSRGSRLRSVFRWHSWKKSHPVARPASTNPKKKSLSRNQSPPPRPAFIGRVLADGIIKIQQLWINIPQFRDETLCNSVKQHQFVRGTPKRSGLRSHIFSSSRTHNVSRFWLSTIAVSSQARHVGSLGY